MLRLYDVSTWQAVDGVDLSGIDALICKATGSDAGNYVDSKCDLHYQRARAQGKLLGVYHFCNPVGSPEEQADFFVDNVQGYIGEALLALDWEYGDVSNVSWAKAWLDRVYQRTGVRPVIYMSGSVANSYDWSSVVNADYGLWCAYWKDNYQYSWDWPSSPDEMNYGTGAWPFWAIWQFSSRNGQLDCDVFNGDREAWLKYAGKSGEVAPAPEPQPIKPSIEELALAVIRGEWGNGEERKRRLIEAGYDYDAVQNRVNEIVGVPQPAYEEYVVQPGDTLGEIGQKFGVSYFKIAEDNGIADVNRIFAGQVLRVYR